MANTHSLDLELSSSQYASIADASQTGLDVANAMTIEAWIKVESTPASNTQYSIVSKWDEASNAKQAYTFLYQNNAGTPRLIAVWGNGSGTNKLHTYNVTLTTGVWYHVCATKNTAGDTTTMYLNGLSVGSTGGSTVATTANSSEAFMIGARRNTSVTDYFDGLIDDVRIWSDVRTASEIQENIGTELVGDEANLVGYWKFNNSALDETSNNNDLTLSGTPSYSTTIPWTGSLVDVSTDGTLATNLVSYWELEEASGTRVDSHGNNDLTDNNTVTSATGIIGNGADFEGSNAESLSITDGSQSGLDFSADMSISLWVKLESQPASGGMYLVSKYASSNFAYRLIYDQGSGIYFSTSSNGTANTGAYIAGDLTLATWTHLALSKTGSISTLYVNGEAKGIYTNTATIYNGTASFVLAQQEDVAYDGMMDEVAVYSRALTAGEVRNLYNSGAGLPYLGSIAYEIVASLGTFTLTSVATGLLFGRKMVASLGTFTLTSVNTVLSFGRKMVASVGAFVLTGFAGAFLTGKGFLASLGTFTLTGIDAGVTSTRTMVASLGTFTLTGISALFSLGYTLVASLGTFVLTGFASGLIKGYGILASLGTFTLTGVASTFNVTLTMVASLGQFTLSLKDIVIRVTGWRNPFTKNTINPSNTTKNSEDWVNQSKS